MMKWVIRSVSECFGGLDEDYSGVATNRLTEIATCDSVLSLTLAPRSSLEAEKW